MKTDFFPPWQTLIVCSRLRSDEFLTSNVVEIAVVKDLPCVRSSSFLLNEMLQPQRKVSTAEKTIADNKNLLQRQKKLLQQKKEEIKRPRWKDVYVLFGIYNRSWS
jgi:hypothetical protein